MWWPFPVASTVDALVAADWFADRGDTIAEAIARQVSESQPAVHQANRLRMLLRSLSRSGPGAQWRSRSLSRSGSGSWSGARSRSWSSSRSQSRARSQSRVRSGVQSRSLSR